MAGRSERAGRAIGAPRRDSEFSGRIPRAEEADRRRSVEDVLALCLRQESRGKLCALPRDGASTAENPRHDIGYVLDSGAEKAYSGASRTMERRSALPSRIDCPAPSREFEDQGWEGHSGLARREEHDLRRQPPA